MSIHPARERARESLRSRRDFIWNATNLSREIPGRLVDLFTSYQAGVRIVYVEEAMPSMYRYNENRAAALPSGAIADMMHRWEVPTRIEADHVEWWVNEKPIREGASEHR
jgi:predicted kinase